MGLPYRNTAIFFRLKPSGKLFNDQIDQKYFCYFTTTDTSTVQKPRWIIRLVISTGEKPVSLMVWR